MIISNFEKILKKEIKEEISAVDIDLKQQYLPNI